MRAAVSVPVRVRENMTEQELKSYTGTYVMQISDGYVVVTGREKFKNFKAVFPLSEVQNFIKRTVGGDR